MSYIDIRRHELCGVVAGVPLYHPLEEYDDGSGPGSEFSATPQDLVLGGGGGEHPAAVMNVRSCVSNLLVSYEDGTAEEMHVNGVPTFGHLLRTSNLTVEDVLRVADALHEYEPTGQYLLPVGTFDWSGDTWSEFVEAAKNPGGWARPYEQGGPDGSIENWIGGVVGEYVLVSMVDLLVSILPEEEEVLRELSVLVSRTPLYMGVLSFPTGYEYVGGRRESLGDGNVRH